MIINKNELRKGMWVKTTWKGKEYCGYIKNDPKQDAKETAKLTHGRFIAIRIINENNKEILMPYTARAVYKLIERRI